MRSFTTLGVLLLATGIASAQALDRGAPAARAGGDGVGGVEATGGHNPAPGIDNDQDGVLPVAGGDKVDLKLKQEIIGGFAFKSGVWHDEASGVDFGVVLDEWDGVTITLGGQELATGTTVVLNILPGSQEAATVGTSGCWNAPGPVSGPTSIKVTGTGPTLEAAVADYKQEIEDMQALGFTPLPNGDCAPTVDPIDPADAGPLGPPFYTNPGHP